MADADVAPGLEPVAEGETDGDGYVGYHRTFGEARLGDSHLISVRAETRLYESDAAAARAAKELAGQVGRATYAREAAKAFADETQVRPTNVQVRRLTGLKRGAGGVVVTFELLLHASTGSTGQMSRREVKLREREGIPLAASRKWPLEALGPASERRSYRPSQAAL
jgi:hypothetical protein